MRVCKGRHILYTFLHFFEDVCTVISTDAEQLWRSHEPAVPEQCIVSFSHLVALALLQPRLQGAEAVAVRVPGRQHAAHGALGRGHALQNLGAVVLQLLRLLADVLEVCG